MAYNVVVSARLGPYESLADLLASAGCAVSRLPVEAQHWTPELMARFCPGADAYVGMFNGIRIPAKVLEASPRLKVVTSPIIGTEHIDVARASELGIVVAHGAAAENFVGMAEASVMLIAALRKRLLAKMRTLADGVWRPAPLGGMVHGSTVGLVGFGNIGRTVARMLAPWGCRILVADPYVQAEAVRDHGAELVPLDTLLAESDTTVVLVTLTPETHHLIDAAAIATMKAGASLINVGRGGCVDEAALLAALESGRLSGAAIDTWETEPLPADHPLRGHPAVIGTGHVVGHSEELYARMPGVALENTMRALRGETPLHVRNPEVLPRWRERLAALA